MFGVIGLLDGRVAGVLLDVAEQDLFEPGGVVQEVRLCPAPTWRPFPETRD